MPVDGNSKCSRFDLESKRVLFRSICYGRLKGVVLLEDLFLALATVDIGLVASVKLRFISRSYPSNRSWIRNPLISAAFERACLELPFEANPMGSITPGTIASAMKRVVEEPACDELNQKYRCLRLNEWTLEDAVMLSEFGLLTRGDRRALRRRLQDGE